MKWYNKIIDNRRASTNLMEIRHVSFITDLYRCKYQSVTVAISVEDQCSVKDNYNMVPEY